MKNKVFIFDKSQNLVSKKSEKMEKFLLSKGLFNFSFLTFSDFEEFKKCLERSDNSNLIVLCDNDKLDEVLEAVKEESDELSLIREQAVRLENSAERIKIMFIPFELDFETFLEDFVPAQTVYKCSLFGFGRSFVEERFESFKNGDGLDYEIITKSPYLHTAYYSKYIDSERLSNEFKEGVYSSKDESLAESLKTLLQERGKSVSVAEFGCYGKLLSLLECDGTILRDVEALKEFGISEDMLGGENSGKEIAFAMAKNLLAKNDLVLSVCDRIGDSKKSYVSVGDKQVVHLYSSVFSEDRTERMRDLCDFAIYRMLCFLRNQNA